MYTSKNGKSNYYRYPIPKRKRKRRKTNKKYMPLRMNSTHFIEGLRPSNSPNNNRYILAPNNKNVSRFFRPRRNISRPYVEDIIHRGNSSTIISSLNNLVGNNNINRIGQYNIGRLR